MLKEITLVSLHQEILDLISILSKIFTATKETLDFEECASYINQSQSAYKYAIILLMKAYNWNSDKNKKLIEERGISFESVIFHLQNNGLLDDIQHPNFNVSEKQSFY